MIDKLQYLAKKGILGLDALDNHQDQTKLLEMFPAVQQQMNMPDGTLVAQGMLDDKPVIRKEDMATYFRGKEKSPLPKEQYTTIPGEYQKNIDLANKAMRQRMLDQGYTEEEIDSY